MRTIRKTVLAAAAVAAATSMMGVRAQAADYTWDGSDAATNTNWSNALNWTADLGSPSAATDTAVFDTAGLIAPANTVDATLSIAKLTYNQDNSSIDANGSYLNAYTTTIASGATLTLSADPAGNTPSPANANLVVMPINKATAAGGTGTIVKIAGAGKLIMVSPSGTTGAAFNVSGRPRDGAVDSPVAVEHESFAILDMSDLDEFVFSNQPANNFTRSNFGIGTGLSIGNDRSAFSGKVILGNTATVSGNRLVVGGQHGAGSLGNTPVSMLLMGQTTNINPNHDGGNLYVGRDPNIAARLPSGAIMFRPGLTDPQMIVGVAASLVETQLELGNGRGSGQGGTYHAFGVLDGTRASGGSEGSIDGAFLAMRIGEGYNSATNTGGGYGMYSMSRGSISATSISLGRSANANAGLNVGQFNLGLKPTGHASEVGGGSVAVSGNATVGLRIHTTTGGNLGVLNLDNAAAFSAARVLVGENSMADNANGSVTGIVNLGGASTMTTGQLKGGGAAADVGTMNTRLVNFDGGTLRAADATTFAANFMENLTGAYVYAGGGTIDTNGQDLTVAQALLAPTGSGVEQVNVTDGGTKHRVAPIVVLANDPSDTTGKGATAVANIDGVTGAVTGVTVTNPGVGYTAAPIVKFIANGGDTVAGASLPFGGTAAVAASVLTTGAPPSGGFTKTGAGTLMLTGVNTYTGPTVADAGKLVFGKSLTSSSSVSALHNAKIELGNDGSHNQFIKTDSVTIDPGATIDLRDNKLLTNTPAGTFTGGAYTGVQGEVARAYNFGAWDLPGLKTSEELAGPNAGPLSGTTTIGVATGEQILFIGPTDTGVFAGQTITGATTIAMYTYAGDMNFDGLVDAADYGVIDNWVQFPGSDGYANGDLNYDGVIDAADYGIIDNTIQLQGNPFPGWDSPGAAASAGSSGVTAVPEPASLSVLGLAAASLIRRRRRRSSR